MVTVAPGTPDYSQQASVATTDIGIGKSSDSLTYFVPSAVVGFADTVINSVGLTDDDTVEKFAKENLGQFGIHYENANAARTTGDLVGMFVPGLAFSKAMRAGGMLSKAASATSKTRWMNSVFHSGKTYDQLLSGFRKQSTLLAKEGVKDVLQNAELVSLGRKARLTKARDTLTENVAFELGVFATMNESEVLYPAEFTLAENLAVNAVMPGVVGAAEQLYMKKLIRNAIQDTASHVAKFDNPRDLPVTEMLYRPGSRDGGVTMTEMNASAHRRAMLDDATSSTAKSNHNAVILESEKKKRYELEKMATDTPLTGLTRKTTLSQKQLNTINKSLLKDESSVLGTYSIDKTPASSDEVKTLLSNRAIFVTKKREAVDLLRGGKTPGELDDKTNLAIMRLEADAEQANQLRTTFFEVDGTRVDGTVRNTIAHDLNEPITLARRNMNEDKIYSINAGNRTIGVSENLNLVTSGKVQKLSAMGLLDRTRAFRLMEKAVSKFDAKVNTFTVTPETDWLKLEGLVKSQELHGDDVLRNIVDSNGGSFDVDGLEFLAMSRKYDDFKQLMNKIEAAPASKALKGKVNNQEDVRKMLNLPGTSDGMLDPVHELFLTLRNTDADASLGDVFGNMQGLRQGLGFDAAGNTAGNLFATHINNLKGKFLEIGDDTETVFAWQKNITPESKSREALIAANMQQRLAVQRSFDLAEQEGATLVGLVHNIIKAMPSTIVAKKVDTLAEGGQRSAGIFTQQTHAVGETPAMQAVHSLNSNVVTQAEKLIASRMNEHAGVFQYLLAKNNVADLHMLNLFTQARRGQWKLTGEVVEETQANGTKVYGYRLAQEAKEGGNFNNKKWTEQYGEKMPEDAVMPIPNQAQAQGLYITEAAHTGVNAINSLSQDVLKNINHIRSTMGYSNINSVPFHVPAKNLMKNESVFIVNAQGKLDELATGPTRAAALKRAEELVKEKGNGYFIVDRSSMEKYFSLQDEAFERLMDYSDPLGQTRKRATGKSVGRVTEDGPEVLKDMVDSLNRQYQSVIKRTIGAEFEAEINYVKASYNTIHGGGDAIKEGSSIHQQWIGGLMGNSSLNPNSMLGKVYMGAETAMDLALNKLYDKAHAGVTGKGRGKLAVNKAQSDFDKLNASLDDGFNPYKDTLDYLNRTTGFEQPQRAKKIFAEVNKWTSFLALRFLDAGHAVLNLTGLSATMPAVVRALNRLPHESEEQWQARIGSFGTARLEDIAELSPTKLLASATHEMFTAEGRKVWTEASELGYMDQAVAEIMQTMTEPTMGRVEKFFFRQDALPTRLSDRSERWSRGLAFMAGNHIAQRGLGIQDKHARYAFAHKFANDVIGDYRPSNRPQVFQGAVGMPTGLFMTYALNYGQRLFSYIENKNTRALATQYFAQASMFGLQSTPGFQQFSDFYTSSYDGTNNPIDSINNTYGKDASEWLMYGTLSNLPKLFGADDGVALYTRGDMSFNRQPALLSPSNTPGFTMMKNVFGLVNDTYSMFKNQGGFSKQQMLEIVANNSINRPIRNLAFMANGASTDRRGQVLSNDLYNGLSIGAYALGLKPMQEARTQEVIARIRSTEASRRDNMSQLRNSFRAASRGGEIDGEQLSKMFGTYVKYNGAPQNFARFVASNMITANSEKGQVALLDALKDKSPQKQHDLQRVMSLFDLQQGDPEFD